MSQIAYPLENSLAFEFLLHLNNFSFYNTNHFLKFVKSLYRLVSEFLFGVLEKEKGFLDISNSTDVLFHLGVFLQF